MDIINRLNPFHNRTPSSLKGGQTPAGPHPTERAASSFEQVLDRISDPSIDSSHSPYDPYTREDLTPLPANSPRKSRTYGHSRTPSILRTLAHHPSLSALKSKSRRKKKKDDHQAIVSPLKLFNQADSEHNILQPGGGKHRERSLKASRSVPRDLRLSGHWKGVALPPLPAAPTGPAGTPSASHNLVSHLSGSGRPMSTSIRRKPAPSPSPDTPGSDPSSEPSNSSDLIRNSSPRDDPSGAHQRPANARPSHMPGVDLPTRRRFASFDERYAGQASYHGTALPDKPKINEHPHPVPLPPRDDHQEIYAQSLHADSTTFLTSHFPDVPSIGCPSHDLLHSASDTGSAHWTRREVSLDVLGGPPDTPLARPEGMKVDCRKAGGSAAEDDEEKGAAILKTPMSGTSSFTSEGADTPPLIRHPRIGNSARAEESCEDFEARPAPKRSDPLLSTAHRRAESSPAASPLRPKKNPSRLSVHVQQSKRSSSPYEVKLLPSVTHRMSLDAFGTPRGSRNPESSERPSRSDEGDCSSQGSQADRSTPIPDVQLDDLSTQLDTSAEADDAHDLLADDGLEGHESHHLSTIDESMLSSDITGASIQDLSRHTPASLVPQTAAFTHYYTPGAASCSESTTSESVQPGLDLGSRYHSMPSAGLSASLLEVQAEHARALKEEVKTGQQVIELLKQDLEAQRQSLLDSRAECEEKDNALAQAQATIVESEELWEGIQEAHDLLAERYAMLDEEKAQLEKAREEDALVLGELRRNADNLHVQLVSETARSYRVQAKAEEAEARCEQLEKQLQHKSEEMASLSSTHEDSIASAHYDLSIAQEAARTKGDTIDTLTAALEATSGALEAARTELIALGDAHQAQEDIVDFHRELLASEQSSHKDTKVGLAEKEVLVHQLQAQITEMRDHARDVKLTLVQKDADLVMLRDQLSTIRYEKNELLFSTQMRMKALQARQEQLGGEAQEKELAAQEGRVLLARLMEEKRRLEEDKDEMLNQDSRDENSTANLKAKIAGRTSQLADAERDKQTTQSDLKEAVETLAHKNSVLAAQHAELSALRVTLEELEDKLEESRSAMKRHMAASDSVIERLRLRVDELETQLTSHDMVLKSAVTEAECTKASAKDYTSRIDRYLLEIDELKLSETKLQQKVDEARRSSSMAELRVVEAEKRIQELEDDKELLNVALDSQAIQLALKERAHKRVPSTPGTATSARAPQPPGSTMSGVTQKASHIRSGSSLSWSTSRIPVPPTPTPVSGLDNTPLPKRMSLSTSTPMRGRRETIGHAAAPASSHVRLPLGPSTRHNKVDTGRITPSLSSSTTSARGAQTTQKRPLSRGSGTDANGRDGEMLVKPMSSATVKRIERRTSLPMLKRPPSALSASVSRNLVSIEEGV
ncbi:hypothetical protein IAU60_000784 [Kwoniella sp. DSM 27419]